MVEVRRPKTDEEKVRAFEKYSDAMDYIREYLTSISRIVDRKRADITVLKSEAEGLENRKASLDGFIKTKEQEFLVATDKKAQEILSNAINEAKKKADAILLVARTEVASLVSRKELLEKSVKELSDSYAEKSKKLSERIQTMEVDTAVLQDEIAKLTSVRDELQKQIASIKEKVAYLT